MVMQSGGIRMTQKSNVQNSNVFFNGKRVGKNSAITTVKANTHSSSQAAPTENLRLEVSL